MTDVYAKAGVNVSLGDKFSAFAASICRRTWENSAFVEVNDYASGYFRGPRAYDFWNLPQGFKRDGGMDGVGSKSVIIAEAFSPRTAGYDLMAMTAMDRTRWGNLPLYLDNILDVSSLGEDAHGKAFGFFCELMLGLEAAANEIDVVLGYGGELAELGSLVGSENPNATVKFNWAGHMQGAMHPDKIIRGDRITAGDIVVAFAERGPRSNGISAIRRALRAHFGKEWWDNPDAKLAIMAAAVPSVLYDRLFNKLNGWFESDFQTVLPIKCIAHISGGGIPGKFGEDILFRQGLSAELENLPPPPRILLQSLDWLRSADEKISDKECYRMWHGGAGALAVIAPEYESELHRHASAHCIDSRSCGRIVKRDTPQLWVKSKFGSGEMLVFT